MAPLIYSFTERIKYKYLFFTTMFTWIIIYFYIKNNVHINNTYISFILEEFIYYIFPYCWIFAIGVYIHKMTNKNVLVTCLFFLSLFIINIIYNHLNNLSISTQDFKYPVGLYYLSYSLFASLALYIYVYKIYNLTILMPLSIKNIIFFISSASFWIYLWHILVRYFLSWTNLIFPKKYFILNFLILLIIPLLITWIQKTYFIRLSKKIDHCSFIYRYICIPFCKY